MTTPVEDTCTCNGYVLSIGGPHDPWCPIKRALDAEARRHARTSREEMPDGGPVIVGAFGSSVTAEGRLHGRAPDINPLVILEGPWPCEKVHGATGAPGNLTALAETVDEAIGSAIANHRDPDEITHPLATVSDALRAHRCEPAVKSVTGDVLSWARAVVAQDDEARREVTLAVPSAASGVHCSNCGRALGDACAAVVGGGMACSSGCADAAGVQNVLRETGHLLGYAPLPSVVRDVLADVAAKPEIVTGAQAAELPLNSIVVECYADGQPVHGHLPHVVREAGTQRDEPAADASVCVLYRAPEPPALTIEVGQTLTITAELDACPIGAVVRDAVDDLGIRREEGWNWLSGAYARADTCRFPARVLDLGGDS